MVSSKLSPRRRSHGLPPVVKCYPQPPPPPPPLWEPPETMHLWVHWIVRGEVGTEDQTWEFDLQRIPETYEYQGDQSLNCDSCDGHADITGDEQYVDLSVEVWICTSLNTTGQSPYWEIVKPGPHTYHAPPWEDPQPEGDLTAELTF